jgi:uncharacterized protein (DUF1778 family)
MSEPKSKDERLEVRLTAKEKTSIILTAQSKGMTVSDYVRGTAIPPTKKS